MLIGKYEFKIDAKNRVILPSKFRVNLGEKIIATMGYDSGCVNIYSLNSFEKEFTKNFSGSNNLATRTAKREYMAEACDIDVDSQGRIVLPEAIIKKANLSKTITFLGQGDYVEIWNSTDLSKALKASENTFTKLLEKNK